MKKNWVVHSQSIKLRDKISKSLNINPITAQVLINRGISNAEDAEFYLNSSLFDLPSPFLIKGMDKAVERIKKAIEDKEKIAIYGDYDVDGVTSTALFYNFLKSIDVEITYYNPERLKEGYGINTEAIKKLKSEGVSLIVSGDCGITAYKEVNMAKKLGIDFIITDHHKPPNDLPDAVSVLNPHQKDCLYPGKEITGVGVIFNLVIALRRSLRDSGFFKNNEPNLGDYLDLVALGTVADCAELRNVNRIFVKEGLKRMQNPKRQGLRALKEISSVNGEVSSFDLGFKLGPRINASGRLSSAKTSVDLFISEDLEEAREIARDLNIKNSDRQGIEGKIFAEAVSEIDSNPSFASSKSIILASGDWHQGVIGIVASRLVDRYRKPAFLIAVDKEGNGKGSGRSIKGVNIYEVLNGCQDILEQFGGHELAAGITIREENIEEFASMFDKAVGSISLDLEQEIMIDASVDLDDINELFVHELNKLEPFGIGNPEPVFITESVDIVSSRSFKDRHLGLKIKSGSRILDAIWFNCTGNRSVPEVADIVYTPEFNNWNGNMGLRLRLIDIDF